MKKILILLGVALSINGSELHASKLENYFDRQEVLKEIKEQIVNQDVSFGIDLANVNLIDGINLSSSYQYKVEASSINKFYTRIDKWDLSTGVNVGQVLKDYLDVPFSFSINRKNSFYFVRQFPDKKVAMKALPYTPKKLPLNGKLALENLNIGDFVSIPANLSIAASLSASTTLISPVIVNANASIYYVISGEFIIQVFKLDETHVRLKLITQNSRAKGVSSAVGMNFNIFGIRIIDQAIDRISERDLAQYGNSFTPGAQFILDYVFDLNDLDAQEAYNQILSSSYKFKDIVAAHMFSAKELKDMLISSYEKADAIFEEDQKLNPKDRRVQRIFKGFNNYEGNTRHLKFSFLITGYTNDRTFTDSKVTLIDKKGKNLDFFYPTYSKFTEGHLGGWYFDLKDQNFQNNFGLIPRFNLENSKIKHPDVGLTFERQDRYFTSSEQRSVTRFLFTQIPEEIIKNIDLSAWKDGARKMESRIFMQLILKSQGFSYLRNISPEDLTNKLLNFIEDKRKIYDANETKENAKIDKLADFLLLNRYIEKERLINLAKSLIRILRIENSEEMLKQLVNLNKFGIYDKIGLGFLISLLPKDKLKELVYLKLDMIAKGTRPTSVETGTLNYRVLYNELTKVQSRLSNRSYDLRLSDEDRNMADIEIETLPEKH